MAIYKYDLDITPEKYKQIEKSYQYYGLSVQDVIEIMLEKSYLLGDCPFNPTMDTIAENYEAVINEPTPDIDWRDSVAVKAWLMEED